MHAAAIALFIALFAFGGQFLGWSDPDGHVKLALVAAYILGMLFGIKARG